jgi:hypothetical protein
MLVVIAVCRLAFAQAPESNQRMAQSLFDRARTLMADGNYSEACPLLAESQKLDPGGGTLLNLAVCHDKQGKTATAWTEYHEALSLAIHDGRDDRKQIASERIAALDGKIPNVVFELPANARAATLTIEVDGARLPSFSAPLPIDPGEHTLVATAPGFVTSSQRFSVSPAESKRIRIAELVPVAPEPTPIQPVMPIVQPAPPPATETRPSRASWIVGGLGGAALVGAGVTGIFALVADKQSKDHVAKAGCLPERDFCQNPDELADARSARDRAKTLAWVSTGALVVGVAAVTTAFFLPRERVNRNFGATARLAPIGRGFEVGAGISGAF